VASRDDQEPKAQLAVTAAQARRGPGTLEIVTLNHDTVIERALEQSGIEYADGFSKVASSDFAWSPKSFAGQPVRVLKLHGSINWRQNYEHRLLRAGYHASKTVHGGDLAPQAEILAGKHNKMLQYQRGFYGDLHCRFRTSIYRADTLVVSGYSFGDKGINNTLIEWMRPAAHSLVVVHPKPASLPTGARPAAARSIDLLERTGRLRILPAAAEDVSWSDCFS
jgi:hypothetical protein